VRPLTADVIRDKNPRKVMLRSASASGSVVAIIACQLTVGLWLIRRVTMHHLLAGKVEVVSPSVVERSRKPDRTLQEPWVIMDAD
jgi:hypothetical protein